MAYPRLSSTPLVQAIARMEQDCEANRKYAGLPYGTLRGTVVDVDDPQNRGRVRVVFDDMNPDLPQVSNAGVWSEPRVGTTPDASHWIDVSPAFKGRQPKGLIGKRVNIAVSNGQYQYAVLQDVMFDPQILAEGRQDKLKMPNNSSMTRLPCYPRRQLPPATSENVGCIILELQGSPSFDDWLRVCLKLRGKYVWGVLSPGEPYGSEE